MSTIKSKLQDRTHSDNLRHLPSPNSQIDFVSNDYLGLGRSKELFARIQSYDYTDVINCNGSTGSRLLAGNSPITEKLEQKLSGIFKAEAALLFNSGYAANLSLLSCIPQRGDTIIYDQLSHVCIKEGASLSKAKSFSFKHNDCEDLQVKLKHAEGEKYIVIESVYSMDGDLPPFEEIITIAKQYDAKLIIDEAHGTGLYGDTGAGKVCELRLEDNFLARVYTFGKAMGVHGACVAGSKELIQYLVNFARPFIYTTALPIHSIFSIDAAFDFLSENPELQVQSQNRIQFFNSVFEDHIRSDQAKKLDSYTPIQPVIVEGNTKAKQVSVNVQKAGFDIRPILSPTVRKGHERLRISIHTYNTEEEILDLINALSSQL